MSGVVRHSTYNSRYDSADDKHYIFEGYQYLPASIEHQNLLLPLKNKSPYVAGGQNDRSALSLLYCWPGHPSPNSKRALKDYVFPTAMTHCVPCSNLSDRVPTRWRKSAGRSRRAFECLWTSSPLVCSLLDIRLGIWAYCSLATKGCLIKPIRPRPK